MTTLFCTGAGSSRKSGSSTVYTAVSLSRPVTVKVWFSSQRSVFSGLGEIVAPFDSWYLTSVIADRLVIPPMWTVLFISSIVPL